MPQRPHDTSPAAWSTYEDVLARMDGSARLTAAIELSDAVREIRLAGLRSRHPEMRHEELIARLVLEEYGVEMPFPR